MKRPGQRGLLILIIAWSKKRSEERVHQFKFRRFPAYVYLSRQHLRYACRLCPGDCRVLLITYASNVKIPHADRGSCFRHAFSVDERSAALVMVRVQC